MMYACVSPIHCLSYLAVTMVTDIPYYTVLYESRGCCSTVLSVLLNNVLYDCFIVIKHKLNVKLTTHQQLIGGMLLGMLLYVSTSYKTVAFLKKIFLHPKFLAFDPPKKSLFFHYCTMKSFTLFI